MSSFTPTKPSHTSFRPPPSPSPNMRSLLAYCEGLNERDYRKVVAVFDDTLEHRILPKSLGRPVLNKKQYLEYFAGLVSLFKTYKLTLHQVIEAGDVIIVHGSSVAESVAGTTFVNEHMHIIHFVPPKQGGDGLPKMALVKEFIDSASSAKFFTEERAKVAAAKASQLDSST